MQQGIKAILSFGKLRLNAADFSKAPQEQFNSMLPILSLLC